MKNKNYFLASMLAFVISADAVPRGTPAKKPIVQSDSIRMRDVGGVYLYSGATSTLYDSFLDAYADAGSGDSIQLAPGTNDLGNLVFSFTKAGVAVIGRGSSVSVLKANGFTWNSSAANCSIAGLTFTQGSEDSADLMISNCHQTNVMNTVFSDVRFESPSATTAHCFEITGTSLTLNNVHTKATAGHSFVLKGVKNVSLENCSSQGGGYNGLLVKASDQKGDCEQIKINGFKTDHRIYLEAFNSDTEIDGVSVRNAQINAPGEYAVLIGSEQAGLVNNNIKNVSFDAVSGEGESGVFIAWCNVAEGLVFKNFDMKITAPPFRETNVLNGKDWQLENFHATDSADGYIYNMNGLSDSAANFENKYEATVSTFSTGVKSSHVRGAKVDGATLTLATKAGFHLHETYATAGTPIRVTAGTWAGFYKLTDWGMVSTANDPVTNAVIGDHWYEMTSDALSGTTNILSLGGSLEAGIVVAQIGEGGATYASLLGEFSGQAISGLAPGILPSVRTGGFSATLTDPISLSEYESGFVSGTYMPCYTRAFSWNGDIYIGQFGGDSYEDAWIPYVFKLGHVSVKIRPTFYADYGIKPMAVLP